MSDTQSEHVKGAERQNFSAQRSASFTGLPLTAPLRLFDFLTHSAPHPGRI